MTSCGNEARGPTSDMSPRTTFHSWGSSSSDVAPLPTAAPSTTAGGIPTAATATATPTAAATATPTGTPAASSSSPTPSPEPTSDSASGPVMVTQVCRGQGAADTLTSPPIRTPTAQLLIALLSSDGAAGSAPSFRRVSGCGLRWTRGGGRERPRRGSEVWQARVRRTLDGCTITGTPGLRVVLGRDHRRRLPRRPRDWCGRQQRRRLGEPPRSPTAGANSLVAAAGNDWDTAAERTVPAGQQLLAQYLAVVGDTFWAQALVAPRATRTGDAVDQRRDSGLVEPRRRGAPRGDLRRAGLSRCCAARRRCR
jgi:hypothetical protein